MISRCNCRPAYAGRGIRVDEQWRKDFVLFSDWALLAGYKEGLQIDRINNDGDYTPDNCRFVTAKQNCSNRRHSIVWNGITSQEAANALGITRETIRYRVRVLGLPLETAFTAPKTPNGYLRKTSQVGKWRE